MEQQPPPKRGPGRPSQHGEVKRSYFQTRIRESLKQRLEADAAEQGRSLSEEIELRLEESYSLIENRFGGKHGVNLALMLFSTFNFAGGLEAAVQGHPEWTLEQWLPHPECFEEALATLVDSAWAHHPRPVTHEKYFDFCMLLLKRRLDRQHAEQMEATREAGAWVDGKPAEAEKPARRRLPISVGPKGSFQEKGRGRRPKPADENPAEAEKPTDEAA